MISFTEVAQRGMWPPKTVTVNDRLCCSGLTRQMNVQDNDRKLGFTVMVLEGRWPSKTVTVNDRFYSTCI